MARHALGIVASDGLLTAMRHLQQIQIPFIFFELSMVAAKTKTTRIAARPSRRKPSCRQSNNNNNAVLAFIQYSFIGVAIALVHRGFLLRSTTPTTTIWCEDWWTNFIASTSAALGGLLYNTKEGGGVVPVVKEQDSGEQGSSYVPVHQEGPPGEVEVSSSSSSPKKNRLLVCRLVMAETSIPGQTGLGIFALRDLPNQSPVLYGEPAIPLYLLTETDAGRDSLLADTTGLRFLLQQSNYQQQQHEAVADDDSVIAPSYIIGGISMLAKEHPDRFNVAPKEEGVGPLTGGSSRTATAVPSSYQNRLHYHSATRSISAGEEIVLLSSFRGANGWTTGERPRPAEDDRSPNVTVLARPTAWLHEHGTCVDNLEDVPAKDGRGGLGAQSTRFLPMGSLIAPVPVVPIARDSLRWMSPSNADDTTKDDESQQMQLLLNYCYGHPNSPVLLFPYGPSITLVNHNGDRRANAELRWSQQSSGSKMLQTWNASQILASPLRQSSDSSSLLLPPLLLELVALRDIHPREPVLISYGADWQAAYQKHVVEQQQHPDEPTILPASTSFRHAIGLPNGVFPTAWLAH
jgi:hypothetical protein